MGNTDRIIRIVIAFVVATLFFTNTISGTLGIVLMIVAAIFLLVIEIKRYKKNVQRSVFFQDTNVE